MSLENIVEFISSTWQNNIQISNFPLLDKFEDNSDIICTYSNIDENSAKINIYSTEESLTQAIILRDKIISAYSGKKNDSVVCNSYAGKIMWNKKNWHIIINLEFKR
jgi:hypothetical protein